MVALVKNNLEAIRDACIKHHVKTLYLVGSAMREVRFTKRSDVEFLYRFKKEEIEEMEYADNFLICRIF
jgi:predicted nucleotidyltransferase